MATTHHRKGNATSGARSLKGRGAEARVLRLSVSPDRGQKKRNVKKAYLLAGHGIVGDAHARTRRPVSLLPYESFAKLKSPCLEISPGDFAENITTIGLDFSRLKVGTRISLGETIQVEVTQIGKECHQACVIRKTVGDCIMPGEGVFARVIEGGVLREGDPIRILD